MKQKLIAFMKNAREFIVEGLKVIAISITTMAGIFVVGAFGGAYAAKIGLFKPLDILLKLAQQCAN